MVVLEGSQMATTTLGGPYAQGAPALKIVQKRFLGLHQWLSPVYSKEIKEQLVSVTNDRCITEMCVSKPAPISERVTTLSAIGDTRYDDDCNPF